MIETSKEKIKRKIILIIHDLEKYKNKYPNMATRQVIKILNALLED